MELEKGESRDIEVRYGDNPTLLATNFCLQEGLSSEAVPSIANYIADHIAEEQAQMDMIEEAEEDEGSRGGGDVYWLYHVYLYPGMCKIIKSILDSCTLNLF